MADPEEPAGHASWADAWVGVHGTAAPGYTYDCERNAAAAQFRSRLDKVVYTGGGAMPTCARLVGTGEEEAEDGAAPGRDRDRDHDPNATPPPRRPRLTPSDHFGLRVDFAI